MPNPNPADPMPPGSAGNAPDKFPQYGLNPNNGDIKTASDNQEKVKLIKQGYVDWFESHKAAENAHKGMQGTFGSGNLPSPLHGLDSIGATLEAFYDDITDGKLWRSIGWIVLGALLAFGGAYLWVRTSKGYAAAQDTITKVL